MANDHAQHEKLINLSRAEINQLNGGKFSDFDVMSTIDEFSEQDGQPQNRVKMLALLKLAWRSPELHDLLESMTHSGVRLSMKSPRRYDISGLRFLVQTRIKIRIWQNEIKVSRGNI